MKNILPLSIAILLLSTFTVGCKKEENEPKGQPPTTTQPTDSTITDPRDGQTYKIVQIGNQYWFAENLRYSGSIPEVTDNSQWTNISLGINTTAAWCYYNNDQANDSIYGKLYNWYAVYTVPLCPSGWHIPTDAEWTYLTDSLLGGSSLAGGRMKSTTNNWNDPNTLATNESGFSGLPGGYRSHLDGNFSTIGDYGSWWSFTEYTEFSTYNAWYRFLDYYTGNAGRDWWGNKADGRSCRCLRD